MLQGGVRQLGLRPSLRTCIRTPLLPCILDGFDFLDRVAGPRVLASGWQGRLPVRVHSGGAHLAQIHGRCPVGPLPVRLQVDGLVVCLVVLQLHCHRGIQVVWIWAEGGVCVLPELAHSGLPNRAWPLKAPAVLVALRPCWLSADPCLLVSLIELFEVWELTRHYLSSKISLAAGTLARCLGLRHRPRLGEAARSVSSSGRGWNALKPRAHLLGRVALLARVLPFVLFLRVCTSRLRCRIVPHLGGKVALKLP